MKKPNFKRYTQRQLWYYAKRAFWILVAWTFISNIMFFYEYYTLKTNDVLTTEFDFRSAFTANMIVAICAGLFGGIFTVNLMEYWLRKYAFGKALFLITLAYMITAFLVSTIGTLYSFSDALGLPFYDANVIAEVGLFFGTWFFLKNFIIWFVIVIFTLIIMMVNDKYGPGVFPDYLMGRYFQPKHERRIFMFADIKNATGIAEQLGEEKYFNFLKDFFKDIAPAIVQTRGEVYQYVGDEVVVSWKMKFGIRHANAIQCFYSMNELLKYKKRRYLRKYNLEPEFKVGYHFGTVMVGEIGQIKREIVFSGDVLNTTSRIQAICNELNVKILASKEFGNLFKRLPRGVSRIDLGSEKLRGKNAEMELITYVKE